MRKPIKLEFLSSKPEILEETFDEKTGDSTLKVRMKWQQGNVINKNHRRYNKELLKRETDKISEAILRGEIYGASYHPKGGDAEVDDVSHLWTKVWMEEDGSCIGEATVLPTDRGKNAMVLIKHGRIGVSSRGYGTVTKKTDVIEGKKVSFDEVNEDFQLVSPGDFVLTPSVPDARVMSIIESQLNKAEDSEENGDNRMSKFENIDAIKTEYPDMFKDYEEGLKAEMEKNIEKTIEDKIAETKEAWKKEITDELEKKIDEITQANEGMVEGVREAIGRLSEIPGVIPEDAKPKKEGEEEEEDQTDRINDLEAELQKMKDEKDEEQKAKEAVDKEEKLQGELKDKLDKALEKEENKPFKTLIEKELIEDDKVVGVADVDKVEETVEATKTKISEMLAEAKKNEIISGDLSEKGKIENPDGKKVTEKDLKALWEEAKRAGTNLSFDEYKEKVIKNR